jgi:DUF1680 family protein
MIPGATRRASAALAAVLCAVGAARSGRAQASVRPLTPVSAVRVQLADPFFAPRIETNRRVTIEACLRQCESTGRIANFAIAAGFAREDTAQRGGHARLVYDDSDVYKVIEGIGYSLACTPDAVLAARADAIIDTIAAAQEKDGYLDTYFTSVAPGKRWTNERENHELYCAGHLIEAAVAYEQGTGKRKLLDVALRFAECIDREFGWKKREQPTGHPELELALMKLYRRTNDKRWLALATFFVDVRGRHPGTESYGEYAQDQAPVREQTEAVGHAVRAMYLYSGMADVAAASGDRTLVAPLEKIWRDVTLRRMYITGGVGPSAGNEGFTVPYDLPNETAYCETCAAIGMALWNQRMFLLTRESKYADVLEREIYNNIPAGVSLSGDKFFYDNPLASDGSRHRVPWFECSCCPVNVARFLPAMGERAYATDAMDAYVALYVAGTATLDVGGGGLRLATETDYPWGEKCVIRFESDCELPITMHLRVPGWCKKFRCEWQPSRRPDLNSDPEWIRTQSDSQGVEKDGWWTMTRAWKRGDTLGVHLPMSIEREHADAHVAADVGRVALVRGPVVYCLEGVDHDGNAAVIALPRARRLVAKLEPSLLGGVVALGGASVAATRYADGQRGEQLADVRAVPYCVWDNRAAGDMVVWIPESVDLATVAGERGWVEANGVRVRASHCWARDTLRALIDGVLPKSSSDDSVPRMTFWDHRGTKEWIEMQFAKPRRVHSVRVYWFDDGDRGGCRVPASWTLAQRSGDAWMPVKLAPGSRFGTERDAWNAAEIDPVETGALRIELELAPKFSAGLLEWQVE